MVYLLEALKSEKKLIIKRVLKCIYWALIQAEYQLQLPHDKVVALEKHIDELMISDDKGLNGTAKEIYKKL